MRRLSLDRYVNTKGFWIIFIILIIVGKIVRWTIMRPTLVNMSKGWGYPPHIMNDPFSFTLFGVDDVTSGDIGIGANGYSIMKIFWYMCICIPDNFISFEVAITIAWSAILLIILKNLNEYIKIKDFIFLSLGIILLSIYCFTLAKEPIQMLYFFLLFAVMNMRGASYKTKTILSVATILFSVMTYRTYFILVLLFGGVFYLLIKSIISANGERDELTPAQIIFLFVMMCVCYFVLMTVLSVVNPALFQRMNGALLWASVAASSASTYIDNIIIKSATNNVFVIALEYALMALRILFPVELLKLGPKYWLYVLYQIIMSIMLINSVRKYKTSSPMQCLATVIMVGFVFCSATFETDFGTWVRHNCVTLPVGLIMNGMISVDE